jgi:hypothetical protein
LATQNLLRLSLGSSFCGSQAPPAGTAGASPPITKAIYKLDYTRTNQGVTPIRVHPVIGAGSSRLARRLGLSGLSNSRRRQKSTRRLCAIRNCHGRHRPSFMKSFMKLSSFQ